MLVAALSATVPAVAEAKPAKRYYLALGDSLAAGVQPDRAGVARNTRRGYPNRLARMARGVRLVNYGCGAATTGSFISGRRACLPARDPGYRNVSRRTSQLAAAERFLRRHRRRLAFVTIDIGANDVVQCGAGGEIDLPCLSSGVGEIRRNAPRIARRLRRAAGPRVPMAAMTFYDPFLALWFEGSRGQVLARLSQDLARDQVNAAIAEAFRKHGFRIADVASAFKTYVPFQPAEGESTGSPPVAVAEVCRLTWMCAPAPRGPDVHANGRGHRLIAKTFRRALGKATRRGRARRSG
jgi:lysophospholipase L1-like esterase